MVLTTRLFFCQSPRFFERVDAAKGFSPGYLTLLISMGTARPQGGDWHGQTVADWRWGRPFFSLRK